MMAAYDEMYGEAAEAGESGPRGVYRTLKGWMDAHSADFFDARRRQAELFFRRIGITFAVGGEAEAAERLIPFDIVPRILSGEEWRRLETGLVQRANVLNAFLNDIYGPGECVRAGIIPAELVYQNNQYRVEMRRIRPPHGVFAHICGTDLVRTSEDDFFVLEDNARTPSGVSYMLENREVMMRLFPELFASHRVAPVETYTDALLSCLKSVAPASADADPTAVILTPGPFNSAFYEHSFLADKMGVELVEGGDLFVDQGHVFMRTTEGPRRVDVIYRRVDDDFLDPLVFRPDSLIGVPGLMTVYEAGRVTIVNAPGAGVADDKAVYSYMPDLVRFFTGEEPILKTVPTFRCREPEALSYVLDHLETLVVKEVNGSGGYGMLVGPAASKAEVEAFRQKLKADPDGFIAQPTLALSTVPTFVGATLEARHVDLRPFVLSGARGVAATPGGLTRVALQKGSLVVNSSQGGGTKDTWVLDA
jgi:uncharacterized circularly permuted ATP-grasp superfamily protein